MIVRILLIVVLVLVVIFWVRSMQRRAGGEERRAPSHGNAAPPAAPAVSQAQPMVTCAHCGLHLPRDEALSGPDGVYCDGAHRAAAQAQRDAQP